MHIKNAHINTLTGQLPTAIQIEAALRRAVFKPIGDFAESCEGFCHPFAVGRSDELTLVANGCVFFALRTDKRSLPSSAVEERLAARIAEIEQRDVRKIGRRERKDMKAAIVDELLPQQLPSQALLRGYVDLERRLVVLDTGSDKRAEQVHELLRSNLFLDGVDVGMQAVQVACLPTQRMSSWLTAQACPEPFTIDDEGELQSEGNDTAVIAIKRSDMTADDIRHLLSINRLVTKLGMTWADRVSFVLTQALGLNKLKWTSTFPARAAELGQAEAEEDARAAELTILTGDVRELLADIASAFDGLITE